MRRRAAPVSIEAGENRDAVSLDRNMLDNLPVFDQDYVAAMSQFLDPGSVGTGGVTLVVDGMEQSSVGVSASAIQEVKINQNPYAAEFSRPGRGRIEIITKPASARYHGAFNFLFRDYRLNARNPFAADRPEEQRRIFEGSFTGPVGHDHKTSFLITADHEEDDLQAVVFASGPAGIIQANVANPHRNSEYGGSVTRQLNDRHVVFVRANYREGNERNRGAGGFVLPEAAVDVEDHNSGHLQRRVGFFAENAEPVSDIGSRSAAPVQSVTRRPPITVLDAFTGGGAQVDQTHHRKSHAVQRVPLLAIRQTPVEGRHQRSGYQPARLDRSQQLRRRVYLFDSRRLPPGAAIFAGAAGRRGPDRFSRNRPRRFRSGRIPDRPEFVDLRRRALRLAEFRARQQQLLATLVFRLGSRRRRKTVAARRGGFFYDRTGTQPLFDLKRFNGLRVRRVLLTARLTASPSTAPAFDAAATSVARFAPGGTFPTQRSTASAIERQISKSSTISVSHWATRGVGLFRSRDLNAPPPPLYLARPNPAFSVLRQIESSGHLQSDALEVMFRGSLTRHFTGMAQYTLGRVWTDVAGNYAAGTRTIGINSFPANNYDLSGEWARADYDQRHRLNVLGTVRPTSSLNLGVGFAASSGMPYTMTTGRDDNRDGLANDRPAGMSRNSLQGPGFAELDLRCSYDWRLQKTKKDGAKLTFALDAFNVTNRVNYVTYTGNLSSPFFGQAVAAKPPRRLQLSTRFTF